MQSHAGDLGRLRCHVEKAGCFGIRSSEPLHKTILDSQDYFTLSFPPVEYKPKESYLGSHSGRDGDKFEGSGLHPYDVDGIAVGLEEADLILVCKKIYTAEMKPEFYTDGETYERWNSGRQANNNHSIYMGEIVKVLKKE